MATADFHWEAVALQPLETNGPVIEVIGTNVKRTVWSMDDTTQEYLNGSFRVPTDIDSSGTVTIKAATMAKTAVASKNVALDFDHQPVTDSEDLDPVSPYTTEASGDKAMDATQDNLTDISWTETVSNLGWVAGDIVAFRISRQAASANNLSGDLHLISFGLAIPLA